MPVPPAHALINTSATIARSSPSNIPDLRTRFLPRNISPKTPTPENGVQKANARRFACDAAGICCADEPVVATVTVTLTVFDPGVTEFEETLQRVSRGAPTQTRLIADRNST